MSTLEGRKAGMEHMVLMTSLPVHYTLRQPLMPLVSGKGLVQSLGRRCLSLGMDNNSPLADEVDPGPPDSLLGLLWLLHFTSRPHLGVFSLS